MNLSLIDCALISAAILVVSVPAKSFYRLVTQLIKKQ